MQKTIREVKIGCDPEMFLFNPKTNKFVPAVGLIGGTKKKPQAITNDGHAIQEDNVMVEFNIPPCETKEDFVKHIMFVKQHIDETILKKKGLVSRCIASAFFTEEDLQSEQAQVFGCDPDYSAWTLGVNEIDRSKVNPLLRSAGGHIHVGYEEPSTDVSIKIIQAMDIFLAVPSIILDTDTERRKLYGKAGAFRFKSFGVEHRTLSCFWVDTPELIEWAFVNTLAAINFVNEGGIITNADEIVKCINTCNIEEAKVIIDDYKVDMPTTVKIKEELVS